MLISMTGYGKSTQENKDISITVELRSINSRFLEINHKIPRLFNLYEDDITNIVRKECIRGKILLNINYSIVNEKYNELSYDDVKLAQYLKIVKAISNKSDLINDSVSINNILELPDIFKKNLDELRISFKRVLLRAVKNAVEDLLDMRQYEGDNLYLDIDKRLRNISRMLKNVATFNKGKQKKTLREYKKKIMSGMNLDSNIVLDDQRLLQELVIFLDKKDVNEEVTRLESHIDLFRDCAENRNKEKGKKMSFLLQEFLREVNTIGSKSANTKVSHITVDLKTEIEKIREQVQNIL